MEEEPRSGVPVFVVVPLFEPGPEIWDLVTDLIDQGAHVILVDDTPVLRRDRDWQVRRPTGLSGVDLVECPGNNGIAAALNLGLNLAQSAITDFVVITLDQDSRLPAGYLTGVVQHVAAQPMILAVPETIAGQAHGLVRFGTHRGEPLEPIQSGMAFGAATFGAVGGFDESLFIDGVDADFVLRARNAGARVVVIPGTNLEHALGTSRRRQVGRWSVTYVWHAPFRRYYITRNRLVLFRRHGRLHPEWLVRRGWAEAKQWLKVGVLVGDRDQRDAMRQGWRDFRDGRLGPR